MMASESKGLGNCLQSVGIVCSVLCVEGFVNEYPDVKIDQLVNVLLTRGDVSRGEARQVCTCALLIYR